MSAGKGQKTSAPAEIIYFPGKRRRVIRVEPDEAEGDRTDIEFVPPPGVILGGAAAPGAREDPERRRGSNRSQTPLETPTRARGPRLKPEVLGGPRSRAATLLSRLEMPSAEEMFQYQRFHLDRRPRGSDPRLENLALFGHNLYARGQLFDAQVAYEAIISREPDEAFLYATLGFIYLAQGDDGRALALFEAALSIDPSDEGALVGRAEIRLRRGQPRAALGDLSRAAPAKSGSSPFGARARLLLTAGRSLLRSAR